MTDPSPYMGERDPDGSKHRRSPGAAKIFALIAMLIAYAKAMQTAVSNA
jgi:hypothetical protein